MPKVSPEVQAIFYRFDRSLTALQRQLTALARAPEHKVSALATRAQEQCRRASRQFQPLRTILPRHMVDSMDSHLQGLAADLATMIAESAPN